jgi:hypothetical protein
MRNIENRLRKLEAKRNPPNKPVVVGLATVTHRLPWERIQNLAAGEHMVIDWYRHLNGVSWGRQRISADPADHGRRCQQGGYLVDVMQELHLACPHHEGTGWCSTCRGTSITECRESEAKIEDASVP